MAELPLFEATEPNVSAGYCHCSRCRRRTGGPASPQARIAPGSGPPRFPESRT